MNILRTDGLDRAAIRLINSVSNAVLVTSGDSTFDNAFRVNRILSQKLLNSPLEITLKGAKISVHIDDYVQPAAQLDEMIEIVTLLAKNCKAS